MSLLANLSPAFGWSTLIWIPGMTIYGIYAGGPVMKARKKFDVKYPNLYAVPGVHKNADAFNAVQRGHQNFLEMSHMSKFANGGAALVFSPKDHVSYFVTARLSYLVYPMKDISLTALIPLFFVLFSFTLCDPSTNSPSSCDLGLAVFR